MQMAEQLRSGVNVMCVTLFLFTFPHVVAVLWADSCAATGCHCDTTLKGQTHTHGHVHRWICSGVQLMQMSQQLRSGVNVAIVDISQTNFGLMHALMLQLRALG